MAKRSGSSSSNGNVYSHSKLWLFESCPEFYKLRYIDKKVPPIPTHISLFLGTTVHEALEWLYHQAKHREISVDDLIEYFTDQWTSQFNEDIRVENGDEVDAYNRAVKLLTDYYTKNKPFKQNVIAIERKVFFPIDDEKKYFIQGFIDRLDMAEDGTYEVHDYKTNQSMKKREDFDKDKQLALYHIGLQEAFGKDIKVKLIWHFLSFNRQIVSQRTQEELDKLRTDTFELIKKIECMTEWPACNGKYCDWCSYKRENKVTYESIVQDFDEQIKAIEMKKIADTGQKFLS
ncbi:PD-(D/E)XK nuclease family protein [Candidatus Pacearchaeota archaeon]|nr:PD-(D/E)XK nuclease family protein [Candidatus Pacearchaeota archaeon]